MERPEYRLYVVRTNDEDEIIDKILVNVAFNYDDAFDAYEKLIRQEGHFNEKIIKHIMKTRRKKNREKTFVRSMVTNKNLHGYLGPGGYLLEKTRG